MNEVKKKPSQENRWLGRKRAKKESPDMEVSKSVGSERKGKGSSCPKIEVLGKRGPRSACRVEYPVLKKSFRKRDLDKETIESLKMKIDMLENENIMLKEMAGTPLLDVNERDGSTTCSSNSTTSSSGDERDDYDDSFADVESVLLPSYKPLFVSIPTIHKCLVSKSECTNRQN